MYIITVSLDQAVNSYVLALPAVHRHLARAPAIVQGLLDVLCHAYKSFAMQVTPSLWPPELFKT